MPTVTKQLNKSASVRSATAPKNGSVLSRIEPLRGSKIGRLKVSLYGVPKTGKTRLACTFPKPLLIIGAEDGTASVVGTKGVDFLDLKRTTDMHELTSGPVADGRWKTVVLDTGTKLRDLRVAEIWEERGGPIPERKPFMYADKAWKEVWVRCANDMKDYLRPLLELPNRMDLNVVIIAQEQNFSEEAESSDLIKPAIGSMLGKSLCMFVNAECDYICQTFIREQLLEKKMIVNKKEVITKHKTGKKEFCLRIGPHETYITGFRLPLGRPELPEVLVNPSYESIKSLIQGG